ncbi:MAG: hypothetical protein EOO47_14220, partial [Flavobacterium sp.]
MPSLICQVHGFWAALSGLKTLEELAGAFEDSKTYVENTYECVAYITGAVDAFNTTREVNKLKSCIP